MSADSQPYSKTVQDLWSLAWPVILSGLVTLFIGGNDAVLLVGSSDSVLASAVAASAIQSVAAMALAGLVGASQVLISRAIGSGSRDDAARCGDAGLWLGLWGGVGSALVLMLLGRALLSALSGSAINGSFAQVYLSITLFSLPFIGVSSALRARLTGLGQPKGLLIASASAAAADIAVAIVLNLVLGPFGVAIGTVTGSLVSVLVLGWFAIRQLPKPTGVRAPDAMALLRPKKGDLKDLIALGWPEAILFGASSGAALVVTWLLSVGPAAELAASRILELTTSIIMYTVLVGVGTAAATLLGRAAGGEDHPGFLRILRHTQIFTLTLAAALLGLGALSYLPLLRLCAPPAVRDAAAPVVWLAFAQLPLMALYIPLTAALRAMKDTRTPMIASLIAEYLVFLPLGWVLTRIFPLGLSGVFLTHIVFWMVSVVIVGFRLLGRLRVAATPPAPGMTQMGVHA